MANFNRNQFSYGSSTIPSLMMGMGTSGSSSTFTGTGSQLQMGSLGGGRDTQKQQLEDAAFAARVLGLSSNLTTDLMRGGTSGSSTIPSVSSVGRLGGTSSLGNVDLQPKSSGMGLLGPLPQQQPQLDLMTQSGSRDIPSLTGMTTSYDDIGGRRRDSGYRDEGRRYNDGQGGRSRREDNWSTRRQDESRSSRDRSRETHRSPDRGFRSPPRSAENRDGNLAGGDRGRQNRGQNRNQNQQQKQMQAQAAQAQVAQAQEIQARVAQAQEMQLQAQLQTQQQLQETLQRLQHLEASQQKKDMKMQEMEEMLLRKRKMDDELQRMDIKQRRLDLEMGRDFPMGDAFGPFPSMDVRHDPFIPPLPLDDLPLFRGGRRDRDRGLPVPLIPGLNAGQRGSIRSGQGSSGSHRGADSPYPPDLVAKHGLREVKAAFHKETDLLRDCLLKLEPPKPVKMVTDAWLCCYKCGKDGHLPSKCKERASKNPHLGRGGGFGTVSDQVNLLRDMDFDLHIRDKKLVSLICYVCSFKCNDMKNYKIHLEKKNHLRHMGMVRGEMGDPGRINLAKRLCTLPSVHSKENGDKAEQDYSFLCGVCQVVVPGPYEKHQEVKVHKHKEVHEPRCVTCRLFFKNLGQLRKHKESALHNKMDRATSKAKSTKQEETPAAKQEKKQPGKKTPSEQEKKKQAEKPKAKNGATETERSKELKKLGVILKSPSQSRASAVKSETGIPPGAIIGLDFLLPVSGWFCKVCMKFYPNVTKDEHCAENTHHKNLWEWCKKKNMTLKTVLKKYMVSDPSTSKESDVEVGGEKENDTDMEISKDDPKTGEGSDTKETSNDKEKSSDVQMSEDTVGDKMEGVVEKIGEGEEDEDVDIEGDEEMEDDGDGDFVDLTDDADGVYDNPEGHPMGDDELGEDLLGDNLDDDLGEDLGDDDDDDILEDTSATDDKKEEVAEGTKPEHSMEEIEESVKENGSKISGKGNELAPPGEDVKKEEAPAESDVKEIATEAANPEEEEAENDPEDEVKEEPAPEVKKTATKSPRAARRVVGKGRGKAKKK